MDLTISGPRAIVRAEHRRRTVSHHNIAHDHDDIPRFEPWLGVMAGSLVPAAIALALPHAFAIPLIACTVLLFTAGVVILIVQSRRRARERAAGEPSSRVSDAAMKRDRVAVEAE